MCCYVELLDTQYTPNKMNCCFDTLSLAVTDLR